jgi:hypothetical protein
MNRSVNSLTSTRVTDSGIRHRQYMPPIIAAKRRYGRSPPPEIWYKSPMAFRTNGFRRRLILATALLGVCFNATFMMWHAVARLARSPEAARLAADLAILCHGWAQNGSESADHVPGRPAVPAGPETLACPICQSTAPTLAVLSVPDGVGPPVYVATPAEFFEPPSVVLAEGGGRPRNRGPPEIV